MKLLYWDDDEDQETVWGTVSPTNGLVMAYKRLEAHRFIWPAVKNGVMTMSIAQFYALLAGLDWRRLRPLEVVASQGAE